MNKADLTHVIAIGCQVPRTDASAVINCLLEVIADALERGDDIQISGFGTFAVRKRRGRIGRDPRTGRPITIPASNLPVFKPSLTLRGAINK